MSEPDRWIIFGPDGKPNPYLVYFPSQHAAQASAWRRNLHQSDGYFIEVFDIEAAK